MDPPTLLAQKHRPQASECHWASEPRARRSGIRSSCGMRSKTQPRRVANWSSATFPAASHSESKPRAPWSPKALSASSHLAEASKGSTEVKGNEHQGARPHPRRAAPACRAAACTTRHAPRRVRARHIPWHGGGRWHAKRLT